MINKQIKTGIDLRAYRRAYGISLRMLAKKLNISEGSVRDLELGLINDPELLRRASNELTNISSPSVNCHQ